MNDAQRILHDMFETYKHSSNYKDSAKMEIMCRRTEYEKLLDDMWRIYTSENMKQVVAYKQQIADIKAAGLVVQRSKTTGKHRIIFSE